MSPFDMTIRPARDSDALALGHLARLDSTLYDGAPALVAEVGTEIVAALPLDGSSAFADPFRRTVQVVEMLTLRRDQLTQPGGLRLQAVRRRRRYRAPASA